MISKFEGIVISTTTYGENSSIINILTKNHGLVGVMCKGSKSLKNPLRIKTQKFTYGYFYLTYNENKLSKLNDVDIIDNFNTIKTDLTLISYLSYLTELTYQVVKQNDAPKIFDLFIETIKKINDKQVPLIMTNILEIKYLDYLGVSLNLDSCIKCGSRKGIITISPTEGGYICQNCYRNEKILPPKAIKLIRMYLLVDIKSITKISISNDIAFEINNFIENYYEKYTGLYLKSKEFLRRINNL